MSAPDPDTDPVADPGPHAALGAIRARAPDARARIGLILGSGLGGVAERRERATTSP